MKKILISFSVMVLGYYFAIGLSAIFWNDDMEPVPVNVFQSFSYGIMFTNLFLAGVIVFCTLYICQHLKK